MNSNINVKKSGSRFRLFNNNDPCGMRFYKGDGDKAPWPFTGNDNWMTWKLKRDAELAASKLQKYLNTRQAQLQGKQKHNSE